MRGGDLGVYRHFPERGLGAHGARRLGCVAAAVLPGFVAFQAYLKFTDNVAGDGFLRRGIL
jgi:hypothetical protein